MLKKISEIKSHIDKRVNKEFNEWKVKIRITTEEIGQLEIRKASSTQQREEEL